MKKFGIIMGFALMLALGGVVTANAFWGFGKYESVQPEGGVVSIPVADVDDGAAHYFTYDNGFEDVKFFVLKSSDGVVRAAFDACDVCFGEKKGYSQEGDFMVCNNCGQRFHSARINEVRGGCNPSPLSRTIVDDKVVFQATDIAAGGRYF